MASVGIVHDEIALGIGVSDETLRKHFREELDTGKVRTIAKVADSLVRQALAGNMTAAIFFLKTQAGWRDTTTVEMTGANGGPIQTEDVSARDVLASRIAVLAGRAELPEGNRKPH